MPSQTQPSLTGSTDNSSDDDEILRPRGKLAARLQARKTQRQSSGSNSETGNDSDDQIPTARPRKLLQRRQRSKTPETLSDREETPGLFVSPAKSAANVSPFRARSEAGSNGDDSDEDLPTASHKNSRFMALVAKKRKEREEREADEARKRAERLAAQQAEAEDALMNDDEGDNITDDEGGRKLTQEVARPSRKASKKAMEEMSRETQRLARSMQLAHEAKVKKKIPKAALFERFGFKPDGAAGEPKEQPKTVSSRPTTPGSAAPTDAEMKDEDTPPSSPPHSDGKGNDAPPPATDPVNIDLDDSDGEPPSLEEALKMKRIDKGKAKATEADRSPIKEPAPRKRLQVKLPNLLQVNRAKVDVNDDDELEILPSHKNRVDAIFERIPVNQAKESRPMSVLRKLAHIDDPDKKAAAPTGKNRKIAQQQQPAVTLAEMQVTLIQRAREQAKLERDRHLEMLRAKGIHVQTAEEREKEEQEVEDLVAKARKEAEEIMAKEREAAKKERRERRAAGEEDVIGFDDSDDSADEYVEEEEEEEEVPAELELSGSEEEEEGEEGDEEEDKETEAGNGLVDDAAESADESEGEEAEEAEMAEKEADGQDSDEEVVPGSRPAARRRPRKTVAIDSDDEEEAEPQIIEATPRPKATFFKSPSAANTGSPSVPTSVLRSATKTFIPGLPVAGPAGLGLTQIFAGTMDDSQVGSAPVGVSPTQPRPTFEDFPESNFSQTAREVGEDMIMDSQPGAETQGAETQGVMFNFSQSQTLDYDALMDAQDPSQMSELIPTQDGGYQNYTPLRQRFVEAPASTIDTVKATDNGSEADHAESPLMKRTGKLRRRASLLAAIPSEDEADEEDAVDGDEFGFGTKPSAFNVMKKAAVKEKKKKAAELFNKKKSKAREMVEEQAEESEDEYAGLGGVDGEDSDDSDTQSVKEMIDDETKNNEADERKLAAFYADRERAADEKQVEKLFHDVTTGQLRRKRGGDWDDLSDDDDNGEARRRLKRRQFAKMQRALFADERISQVASNPRNSAFLKTIEDRGSDDELDFLNPPPLPTANTGDSQSSTTETIIPNSQPTTLITLPTNTTTNPRRTKPGPTAKKPSTLGDIRSSLSNLLDEYTPLTSSIIPATEHNPSRSTSPDLPTSTSTTSTNPRRRPAVVDRINLKRSSSNTGNTTNRLAFSTTSTSAFKPPSLLHRAMTNSSRLSSESSSSTGVTTSNGLSAKTSTTEKTIKKGAGKRSGVQYFARENERRAKVEEMERRREKRKLKGVEGRKGVVGGLFGAGQFE
ncbi:hypothetical protein OQA88_13610 [Cercophora sp. LCS_1]